jgi:hypothetical protein
MAHLFSWLGLKPFQLAEETLGGEKSLRMNAKAKGSEK